MKTSVSFGSSFERRQISSEIVHVGIGELRHEIDMGLQRVGDLDFGYAVLSGPGFGRSVAEAKRHVKIGDAQRRAFDAFAGGERDGGVRRRRVWSATAAAEAAATRAGHDQPLLESSRIVFIADALEVAGGRMTLVASAGAIEVLLARLGVTD